MQTPERSVCKAAAVVLHDAAWSLSVGHRPILTSFMQIVVDFVQGDGSVKETQVHYKCQAIYLLLHCNSSLKVHLQLSRCTRSELIAAAISRSRVLDLFAQLAPMAGPSHHARCDGELQQVVSQVLTPFHTTDQSLAVQVSDLKALTPPVNSQVLTPFHTTDQRPFVQLSDVEALTLQSFDPLLVQLMNEVVTEAPFNQHLPQQLLGSQDCLAVFTQPQPTSTQIQPASLCVNGGGVVENRNSPSSSANPQRSGQSRVNRRPAADRSPFYAAGGSRGGNGGRAPRRTPTNIAPVEQHQVHNEVERQRRVTMAELFITLGALLPPSVTSLATTDRSAVVMGAIDYIATLQAEIERLQAIAARTNVSANGQSLICFDHTADADSLTAVTTLPTPGSDASTMASFIGANVAVQVCGQNCFITISSPRSFFRMLEQLLVVILGHGLEMLCLSVAERDSIVVFNFVCQASQNANLLSNNLHAALQSIVNQFLRN